MNLLALNQCLGVALTFWRRGPSSRWRPWPPGGRSAWRPRTGPPEPSPWPHPSRRRRLLLGGGTAGRAASGLSPPDFSAAPSPTEEQSGCRAVNSELVTLGSDLKGFIYWQWCIWGSGRDLLTSEATISYLFKSAAEINMLKWLVDLMTMHNVKGVARRYEP